MTLSRASVNLGAFESPLMLNVTKLIRPSVELASDVFQHFKGLFLAFILIAIPFNSTVEILFSSATPKQANISLQIATGIAQLLTDIAFLTISAWAVYQLRVQPISFGEFLERKFKPLVAESLRSITRILLWSLCFILPGIYKYTQYLFVSYIVFFNEDYEDGKIDALEHSARTVQTHFVKIFITMISLGLISFALELGPKAYGFSPLAEAGVNVVGFAFSLFSFMLFYSIYDTLNQQLQNK